jgi:hypothetical protein
MLQRMCGGAGEGGVEAATRMHLPQVGCVGAAAAAACGCSVQQLCCACAVAGLLPVLAEQLQLAGCVYLLSCSSSGLSSSAQWWAACCGFDQAASSSNEL